MIHVLRTTYYCTFTVSQSFSRQVQYLILFSPIFLYFSLKLCYVYCVYCVRSWFLMRVVFFSIFFFFFPAYISKFQKMILCGMCVLVLLSLLFSPIFLYFVESVLRVLCVLCAFLVSHVCCLFFFFFFFSFLLISQNFKNDSLWYVCARFALSARAPYSIFR